MKYVFLSLVILIGMRSMAQVDRQQSIPRSFSDLKGDYYFDHQNYVASLSNYKKSIEQNPRDVYGMLRMAAVYQQTGDSPSAIQWYRKAFRVDPEVDEDFQLKYMSFLSESDLTEELEQQVEAYRQRATIKGSKNSFRYVLHNLKSINSPQSDMAPAVYGGKIIFVSDRPGGSTSGYQIFSSVIKSKSELISPQSLAGSINSGGDEGPFSILPASNKIFFSRTTTVRGKPKMEIFFGDIPGETSEKNKYERLDIPGLKSKQHPALSSDGKVIYFSAINTKNNSWDLFKSEFDGKKWSQPVPLGNDINSSNDELYPSLFGDSILFFTSNRKGGLGGLDIYTVKVTDRTSPVTHFGEPVNSEYDDFGLVLTGSGDEGYLSSNRPGGMGGNDIYKIYFLPSTTSNTDVPSVNSVSEDLLMYTSSGDKLKLTVKKNQDLNFELFPGVNYTLTMSYDNFKAGTVRPDTKAKLPKQNIYNFKIQKFVAAGNSFNDFNLRVRDIHVKPGDLVTFQLAPDLSSSFQPTNTKISLFDTQALIKESDTLVFSYVAELAAGTQQEEAPVLADASEKKNVLATENENLKKDSTTLALVKENVKKDSVAQVVAKETLKKDSIAQVVAKENARKDSIAQAVAKETVKKDSIAKVAAKETVKKDSIAQVVAKETLKKNSIAQVVAKETLKKDSIASVAAKETMKKDSIAQTVAKENLKKDSIARAAAKENLKKDLIAQAVAKENLKKDSIAKVAAKETMKKDSIARVVAKESARKDSIAEAVAKQTLKKDSIAQALAKENLKKDSISQAVAKETVKKVVPVQVVAGQEIGKDTGSDQQSKTSEVIASNSLNQTKTPVVKTPSGDSQVSSNNAVVLNPQTPINEVALSNQTAKQKDEKIPRTSVEDLINSSDNDETNFVYRVQIAAAKFRLDNNTLRNIYRGPREIKSFTEDGYNKYFILETPNFLEARQALKESGVDGFIAAYKGSTKWNLYEAITMQKKDWGLKQQPSKTSQQDNNAGDDKIVTAHMPTAPVELKSQRVNGDSLSRTINSTLGDQQQSGLPVDSKKKKREVSTTPIAGNEVSKSNKQLPETKSSGIDIAQGAEQKPSDATKKGTITDSKRELESGVRDNSFRYRVQIGAFRNELKESQLKGIYKGSLPIRVLREDGINKYYIEETPNYYAARKTLRESGVAHGFISVYRDDKKLTPTEAIELQYKKPATLMELASSDSVLKMVRVAFDFDSFTLTRDEKDRLVKDVIGPLKTNSEWRVMVNGFTDTRGSEGYNVGLSRERALFVQQVILEEGIAIDRISTGYFGESQLLKYCPPNENCDESVHQANRRVEILLLTVKPK